jgi:GAF domain-containing protein
MVAPLPADEGARLDALRHLSVLDTPPEPAFDDIAELVTVACATPISIVSFVDEQRQWFKSAVGIDTRETPRDVSFCAHAIHRPELFEVPDTATDHRFADNPLVVAHGLRFYAGFPFGNGHLFGTVAAIDRRPRHLGPEQVAVLRILARHDGLLLELRRTRAALAAASSDATRPALAALTHDITWLRGRLQPGARAPSSGVVQQTLDKISRDIDQLETVRGASLRGALDADAIQQVGLAAAMEWLCHRFARQNGIRCDFSVWHTVDDLRIDIAVTLCTLLTHALDAAARPASVRRVTVELARRHDIVLLELTDDGTDTTDDDCAARTTAMQSLARPLGGNARVRPLFVGGRSVTVWLPL